MNEKITPATTVHGGRRSIEWFGRNHVSSLSLVSLRHMFRLGKEKLLPGEQKRRPWSLGNAFFEGYRWIRVMKRHIVYPGGINSIHVALVDASQNNASLCPKDTKLAQMIPTSHGLLCIHLHCALVSSLWVKIQSIQTRQYLGSS